MTSETAVDLEPHPLTQWDRPVGLPDFSRLADGDFGPVFDAALAAHQAEIEAIAGNPEAPTIDNTLAALELGRRAADPCLVDLLVQRRRPYQRHHPGDGARHLAENGAALLGDLDERGFVRPH